MYITKGKYWSSFLDNPYFVFLFHIHLSAKLRMFQHRQKSKKRPPRNSKKQKGGNWMALFGGFGGEKQEEDCLTRFFPRVIISSFFFEVGSTTRPSSSPFVHMRRMRFPLCFFLFQGLCFCPVYRACASRRNGGGGGGGGGFAGHSKLHDVVCVVWSLLLSFFSAAN